MARRRVSDSGVQYDQEGNVVSMPGAASDPYLQRLTAAGYGAGVPQGLGYNVLGLGQLPQEALRTGDRVSLDELRNNFDRQMQAYRTMQWDRSTLPDPNMTFEQYLASPFSAFDASGTYQAGKQTQVPYGISSNPNFTRNALGSMGALLGAGALYGGLGGATAAGADAGAAGAGAAGGGINPSYWSMVAGGSEAADAEALQAALAAGGSTPSGGMIASMADPQGLQALLQGPGYGPTIGSLPVAAGGSTAAAGGSLPWWQLGLGTAGSLPSIMDQATPQVTGTPPASGSGSSGLLEALKASAPAAQTAAALKNLLGVDVSPNTLGLLGTLGSTALGAYGANQQANALTGIANQARNDRLPFLQDALDILKNPSSFYERPEVMGAVDASLRGLSARVGNPINNPGALAQQAAYNLGMYNNALTSRANLGLAGQDLTSRLQTNAALANNGVLNSVGSGLGSLLSTQPNLSNVLAEYLARSM